MSPFSMLGRIVGTLTALTGLIIVALPVIIVSSHFQIAYNDLMAKRSMKTVKGSNSGQLLKGVNMAFGCNLFTKKDMILFVQNNLTDVNKVIQLLQYENGWAYL